MSYRDLLPAEHSEHLEQAGLGAATARFVASLDASIARGDLETDSNDLERLLGRPVTPLAEVVRAAWNQAAGPGVLVTQVHHVEDLQAE